ncbi:MAG: hypothetical protein ACYDBB_23165 [Armatimonadota bacterium]
MLFEKFTSKGRSFVPRASISRTGLIGLNHGARERLGLDQFTHCILYYDRSEQVIGIELTNDGKSEGAQKIRFRTTGADIAGKSFMLYFDLDIRETALFPITRDDDTGFLMIKIKEGKVRGGKVSRATAKAAGDTDQ